EHALVVGGRHRRHRLCAPARSERIGTMTFQEALRIVMRPDNLRRTVKIALVVGTLLTVINQLDVILKGDAVALTWIKCGLNYCVPFVVSNLGLLAGKRDEEQRDSSNSST